MKIFGESKLQFYKFKYVAFNRSEEDIEFRVVKIKKLDDGKLIGETKDEGCITKDGNIERDDYGPVDILPQDNKLELNWISYLENDSLFFNLSILNIDDEISLSSSVKQEQRVDTERGYSLRHTYVSNNDVSFNLGYPNEEPTFIIIYPNSPVPALIRVILGDYDRSMLLNIDDNDCLYNSYYQNINVETEVITHNHSDKMTNLPWSKFENNDTLNNTLGMLSTEEFEGDRYYNSATQIVVDDNEISICGNDFVKANETAKLFYSGDLFDLPYFKDIKEMFTEILDVEVKEEELHDILVNDDKSCVVIHHDSSKLRYNILAYNGYAIFECYNSKNDVSSIKVLLVDIKEAQVISEFGIYKGDNDPTITVMTFGDVRGAKFNYRIPNSKISISYDPIETIHNLNKFVAKNSDLKKDLFYDLLSGEDEKGKYILVRGIFGNLMKKYI